jgi:hypothetical protein
MNINLKLTHSAVAAALLWLCTVCGCKTEQAPRYTDLLKTWKPIAVHHVADGTHIRVVQSITNGIESGKYICPWLSSLGPNWTGEVLKHWGVVDLGSREGLADVYDYTKGQQDGATNGSQPVRAQTNQTSGAAGSRR